MIERWENRILDTGPKRLLVLGIALLLVGCLYSGRTFFANITSAIPCNPVLGGLHSMLPGDHLEQFYRYSLVKWNLLRGYWPYFNGYQFATGLEGASFSEGLIFFPFTVINALLALVLGDFLAYNLLALLSYVAVGLAGYALTARLTGSRLAGVATAFYAATVPFRTSFLYGEMVFGMDAVLLPVVMLLFEKAMDSPGRGAFFWLGVWQFLLLTANFQAYYWFVLIYSPYCLYRLARYLATDAGGWKPALARLGWVLPGLLLSCAYILYVKRLMDASALQSGQMYQETLSYTPALQHLFQKYSGNEKNMYLGWTALAVLPLSLVFCWRGRGIRRLYPAMFLFMVAVAMYLCFGPRLDAYFGVGAHRWLFDHFPGFNGTRTPGRIMAVASSMYAVLLGVVLHGLFTTVVRREAWRKALVALVSAVVVLDFFYVQPAMCSLPREIRAYERIAGEGNRVLTVPFQKNSAHYLNCSFLIFALRYDLRLLTGHSSIYPKALDEQVARLYSINSGDFSEEQWNWLRANGYKYIAVNYTPYQPRVVPGALAKLFLSPWLSLFAKSDGVYVFALNAAKNTSESKDFHAFARVYADLRAMYPDPPTVEFLAGWFSREAYPDQKPFRWMDGVRSQLVVDTSKADYRLSFEYRCPDAELSIQTVPEAVVTSGPGEGGWQRADIQLNRTPPFPTFIELKASRAFRVATDERVFGCHIGDPQLVKTSD